MTMAAHRAMDGLEEDRTEHLRDLQPNFATLLGLHVISATPMRIESRLDVAARLTNRNGVMHGGAVMALADNMAGTATALHLGPGQTTTTVESKTNFFRALPEGDTAHAVTTPVHIGRRTIVWKTDIMRGDGKLAACVTQTQLVMSIEGSADKRKADGWSWVEQDQRRPRSS